MPAIMLALGVLVGSIIGYDVSRQLKPGETVKLCPGESLAVSQDITFTVEKGIVVITKDR